MLVEIDNSMRQDFDSCPQLYYLRHELKIVPKEPKSMAPYFGIAIHKGNSTWYKGDEKDDEKALKAFGEEYAKWYDGRDQDRTAEVGYFVLRSYFKQFREDYLKTMEVEIAGAIEIGEVIYHFRIDRLVRDLQEELGIEDWKTTKHPGSGFVPSEPNNQFTGYTLGAGEITGEKIKNVYVTQIGTHPTSKERKSKANPNPEKEVVILRDLSVREKWQIEEFKRGLELTVEGIEWCRGREFWPKQTNSCPSFNGCEYIPLCKVREESIPFLVESMYKREERRPWEMEGER